MNSNIDYIKDHVINIEEIKYENGVIHYRLNTGEDTFMGDVNKYTAKLMSKLCNINIIPAEKTTVALNYDPYPISNHMIRQ